MICRATLPRNYQAPVHASQRNRSSFDATLRQRRGKQDSRAAAAETTRRREPTADGSTAPGVLMSEHVFEFLARVMNALARQMPLARPIALTSLCEGRSFEADEKRREKNGDRRRPQAGHGGKGPVTFFLRTGQPRQGRRVSSRRVFSARQLILIGCGRKVAELDEPGWYLVCVLLVGPTRAHDENAIKNYVIASTQRDWSTMQSTFECVFIKYQVS